MMSSGVLVQGAKADMSATVEESLSNIKTVKAFAEEKGHVEKFEKANWEVFEFGRSRAYFWALFFFANGVLGQGATVVIILVMSLYFEEFGMTAGKATAILLYQRLVTFSIMGINTHLVNISKVYGSSYKCAKIIVAEKHVQWNGKETIPNNESGQFNLTNLKFAYPSKPDVPILKGVNIEVKTNQIVALVGASGCGKSSIIGLLERFYDPDSGKVIFNDLDLKDVENEWYHQKQVAIVQQEPILFSGSIKSNILYGVDFGDMKKEQIQARLETACRQANCLHFILDKGLFPEGFETKVGERGMRLSGGQKQRIAIARALVRQPKVLLLDEATSALDAESEHQVQAALDILIEEGSQTVVVIAHRLSTIRNADKIIVMNAGQVIEMGSHDELVEKDGAYKKLVARQLMKDEITKIDENLKKQ